MPFGNQQFAFTRQEIEAINPEQHGCYGIFNNSGCIYVGKGDIRTRMMEHFRGDNPEILHHGPTYWLGTVTGDMDNEEKRLIVQHRPAVNKRFG